MSRRVFPRDSLSPNPRSPSLPSRQAGAVPPGTPCPPRPAPLLPAPGAALRPRAAGFSSWFLCVLWLYRLLACAPRGRFAAFVRGAGPAGPRPVRPAAHLGGPAPGSAAIGFALNGIKRLSVTFSVISTFRKSAILRGKWERCHWRAGVFV